MVYKEVSKMEGRLREVVRYIGPSTLAKRTGKERQRWQTVATDIRTKARLEDFAALIKAYPEYELYIVHGEIDPVRGQISPGYSEADGKLAEQKAGSR